MGRRSAGPLYRMLRKDSVTQQYTCVVAGPSRREAWLYVHAPAPTVLRLRPPVVEFLRGVLAELDTAPGSGSDSRHWALPKGPDCRYPACVVVGQDRADVWLHVFAATPTAVKLVPRVATFLRDALADLPAADEVRAVAG